MRFFYRLLRRRRFGPFASVWQDGPEHLPLLWMSDDARPVLGKLSDALASVDSSQNFIRRMLQDPNWRPQLVAAVAILLSSNRWKHAAALWAAFDSGSWVSPQRACTLYFADPDFAAEARHRIATLCPVSVPSRLSNRKRVSATGPAGPIQRSAKNVASLLRVLGRLPAEAAWVASELDDPEVQELLGSDIDSSAEIADGWFDALCSSFAEIGRDLRRPAA